MVKVKNVSVLVLKKRVHRRVTKVLGLVQNGRSCTGKG